MTNAEQQLLQSWRNLPSAKQQQVLQYVRSLGEQKQPQKDVLEHHLRQIRAKIVASGEPLLNKEQIEQEVNERRGGLKNIEQ